MAAAAIAALLTPLRSRADPKSVCLAAACLPR
jgi:hypothetical protein